MGELDIPVLALAQEYRGEARTLRRSMSAALLGIAGFGVLYLVPYVGLVGEEGGLTTEDASLAAELAGSRARLASLERARELVGTYETDLEARSHDLAEAAKASVRHLNELLAHAADPFDESSPFLVQQTEQAQSPNQALTPNSPGGAGQAMFAGPFGELARTYGLDGRDVEVLTAGRDAAPADWQRVADRTLARVMADAKAGLRTFARERAERVTAALAALNPPIAGELDGAAVAAEVVVPDDAAPPIEATPETTGGKDEIMAAEFQHIRVPTDALDRQLDVSLGELQATSSRLDARREELAARVAAIGEQKAELEASMERTAAELEDFALPFGVLEWNARRLTRWFPLVAALALLWFAAATARLDRRLTAIRAHLAGFPEHDRALLCGSRALPAHAAMLTLAGAYLVWLQRATGAAADGWLLGLVAATCAVAVAAAVRPLW